MSAPVFLAEPADLTALSAGDTYVLTGTEGHHAAVVQRRGVGEEIEIVDGAGTRLRATVSAVRGRELEVQVLAAQREAPSHPQITIVQGLIKGGGDEAVAAMTEAGVDAILPWQAQRSISRWQGPRAQKGRDKWQATARESAKQSRRAFIPQVRDVVQNKELTAQLSQQIAAGALVLVAHEVATQELAQLTELKTAPQVWCLIGPEGGISAAELAEFTDAGARPVRLGAHVLRAVTAGTVATALLRAFTADGKTQ